MTVSWQRVANIGPQAKFPVPTGILDPNGKKYVPLVTHGDFSD